MSIYELKTKEKQIYEFRNILNDLICTNIEKTKLTGQKILKRDSEPWTKPASKQTEIKILGKN